MTTEAVIVSTARTGVGKAYRGALNNTEGPTLAGHVMAEAVKRAGIAPGEVEDVVMGCAMQQGTMVMNVARKGAIRAGLPVTVAGTTIDRQCASGLQAIAVAARSVMHDGVEIAIGGGIESISLVQNEHMNRFHAVDDELMAMKPEMYMSMLETAEVVAERYNIGRDQQDEYSLECQRRVGAALQGGRFNDEIVPITTKMAVVDKDTKAGHLPAGDACQRTKARARTRPPRVLRRSSRCSRARPSAPAMPASSPTAPRPA